METIFETRININRDNDGYVFVYPKGPDGSVSTKREDGVFVSIKNKNLNTALSGDIVKIEILGKVKSEKTNEMEYNGRVIEIIKRGKYAYVGTLQKISNSDTTFAQQFSNNIYNSKNIADDFYKVIPSDRKIHIDFVVDKNLLKDEDGKEAHIGDKVAVVIKSWKNEDQYPYAVISKTLGKAGDNNTEMLAYAIEKGFGSEHYEKSIKESEDIKARGIKDEDLQGRRDMRDILTFTIDPSDARDFDDAISFQKLNKKNPDTGAEIFEIGIHIADVSFYIKSGMELDREAIERQTSVYLVDRVIPMLPEVLSNDLCSLVEAQDRLVMSAIFEMDNMGNVYNEWYGRSVIHSNKRWTYEEAQIITENARVKLNNDNTKNTLTDMEYSLIVCDQIAKSLFQQRIERGALIIETEEVKFKLNEDGHPVDVYVKHRQDIHKMIEEMMLLANRKVSEFITMSQQNKFTDTNDKPICIYRVHDNPEEDRMSDLAIFIRSLGDEVKIVDGIIPSEVLNGLLLKYKGRREEDLLGKNITKSMAKAIYSTDNRGHYGLAFEYYTHFTSPIRRYPDVLAHRLLQNIIDDKMPLSEYKIELEKLCAHASMREKEAADAERASIRHKQIEYMGDRIGKVYDGVISFINRGGVFVEDKKSKSEGLVRLRDLGTDYYDFDEKHGCIKGKYRGEEFHVGDEVRFKVRGVDLEEKTIEYTLMV